MTTPIGQRLRDDKPRRTAAGTFVACLVLYDYWLASDDWWQWRRFLLPVLTITVMLALCRWDPASLGLRIRPIQGYRYWIRTGLLGGLAISVFCGLALVLMWAIGRPFHIPVRSPVNWIGALRDTCVGAPWIEEPTYRLAICVAAVGIVGGWGAILVSGAAFAFLHVLYHNVGPDNMVAGFFLAWAYLRSGSILVAAGMHAIWNLGAGFVQIGAWYWQAPG